MNIIELGEAAAALGYVLVERDIFDSLLEDSIEAEELRCDFARLTVVGRVS